MMRWHSLFIIGMLFGPILSIADEVKGWPPHNIWQTRHTSKPGTEQQCSLVAKQIGHGFAIRTSATNNSLIIVESNPALAGQGIIVKVDNRLVGIYSGKVTNNGSFIALTSIVGNRLTGLLQKMSTGSELQIFANDGSKQPMKFHYRYSLYGFNKALDDFHQCMMMTKASEK